MLKKNKNIDELVEVFKKCQLRLDDKLKEYEKLLNEIKEIV